MGKEQRSLEAIRYTRAHLELLDQRKLPHESIYVEIVDSEAAWHAIKDMVVRGAPAIAVTAALALAVEVSNLSNTFDGNSRSAASHIDERLNFLVSSRPTAVNLADAAEKLKKLVSQISILDTATAKTVFDGYVSAAENILAEDVISNKAIAEFGVKAIEKALESSKKSIESAKTNLRILTHCNTGSLATAGWGTALGVIRTLHSHGKLETAYCTETRPYNQGSRLTAYELVHDDIPGILIADSAAGALLSSGRIDAVVVGADRIAANGDTANKIGTLNLALAAHQIGIPFFVAAPLTSVDTATPSGREIVIEERAHSELTHANGGAGAEIAAPKIGVWNPAFDVTDAKFITAVVTDKGVIWRDKNSHTLDMAGFIHGVGEVDRERVVKEGEFERNNVELVDGEKPNDRNFENKEGVIEENIVELVNGKKSSEKNSEKGRNYFPLNEKAVAGYLATVPALADRLGGSSAEWDVREVGDGNLNFVYIVKGPHGALVLKQSLPYVRCVGDSWPMTLERTYFEYRALKQEFEFVPDLVPEIYHFDHPMAVLAMRYVEPPHIILRKGLINGIVYPRLAEHISTFMCQTLFHTSLLALSTTQHKDAVAQSYRNVEMCRLTEQVIFTEPYMVASNNHWTSPQLDDEARGVREDDELKLEVVELKIKFCSQAQAVLHGDLHTGSIMVTDTSTKVIDPEFSFYGPSGFDIGAFIGNLLLAYYSQDGHAQAKGDRDAYKRWILQTVANTWTLFETKFRGEWDRRWDSPGDAYVAEVFNNVKLKQLAQTRYLRELLHDSLGFAGAKMIRRILGIAHVEDLESILDADRRAAAERQALKAAKFLLKERRRVTSINQVVDFVAG